MAPPNSDAVVMVMREDDTPAEAPDNDADAHITVSTNIHSLPKLNMSFSFVPASHHRREFVKKTRIV